MDAQYGIVVYNKFQLDIDDDDDPFEILKKQEEANKKKELKKNEIEKTKSGKNKLSKKTVLQPETKNKQIENQAPKKEVEKSSPPQKERIRSGKQNRDVKDSKENIGERRPPPRRLRDENVPPEFRDRPEGFTGNFGRGGGERGRVGFFRGGRGSRGRGRGRGDVEFRGKRDFDRHSGSDKTSGVKANEKKEGSGSYNWGTVKDDLDEQTREIESEPTPEVEEHMEPTETKEETEPVTETEPEAKEMTLDEWKSLQNQTRVKPKFNIRKPGEGDQANQGPKTGYYALKKKITEDESDEEEEEEEDEEDHHAKNTLNIKITFNDSPRRGRGGRRSRGPRGMPGTRGERGGGRGERRGGSRELAPRVDDENDFPRLVKIEA